MPLYYVSIPCYVSKKHPEVARNATRVLHIPVVANSELDAVAKVQDALTSCTQGAAAPREISE